MLFENSGRYIKSGEQSCATGYLRKLISGEKGVGSHNECRTSEALMVHT